MSCRYKAYLIAFTLAINSYFLGEIYISINIVIGLQNKKILEEKRTRIKLKIC